jgi:hypothetical protein
VFVTVILNPYSAAALGGIETEIGVLGKLALLIDVNPGIVIAVPLLAAVTNEY